MFEAVATRGDGVFDTLKAIIKLVLADLRKPLNPLQLQRFGSLLDSPGALSIVAGFPVREVSRAMYAVIETGGKQFRVQVGEVVRVERLDGDVGAPVVFDRVLMRRRRRRSPDRRPRRRWRPGPRLDRRAGTRQEDPGSTPSSAGRTPTGSARGTARTYTAVKIESIDA